MRNEKRSSSIRRSRQTSIRSSGNNEKFRIIRDSASGQNASNIEISIERMHPEKQYQIWWTTEMLIQNFRNLAEDIYWNCYICIIAIAAIIWTIVDFDFPIFDGLYNISYAIHVLSICYNLFAMGVKARIWQIFGYFLDLATFTHYLNYSQNFKMLCYYFRLHRPFRYFFSLIDFNLKGSVLGTTAKYCYIFLVLRITWAFIWLHIDKLEDMFYKTKKADRNLQRLHEHLSFRYTDSLDHPTMFLSALYLVNKMFIPIGPSMPPKNDIERCVCLLVMLTGCLVVTGFAVASLSLVISLYMRPEESFRTRYRLIIKDMKDSHIPPSQREKVETFYKMYWHKQRAVSATQLLPTFPPTLPATIYTDIYFAATQKSRVLKDLTYHFLSELAKHMETIHYIPGDTIIKRSSKKSSLIYITYGDIELVTPEDDSTAILRMTRGTVLTPCGVCAPGGFGRAHLQVRAATFCTAHLLHAQDLWRVAAKYGCDNDQVAIILDTFNFHLERVKKHHNLKIPEHVKHLSSILHLKRCLMGLKEAKNASGQPLMGRTDFFLEVAGCYTMRNRTEISFIDEADAICLRPIFPCILQPTSSLQFAWHSFVACLTVAVCFIHPYYLVFRKTVPIEFRFFDYMVTAIYVLDLIVHLSTGDNVEGGVPITFTQTSSQQMKSPWFVQDVLSTLPIFEFIGSGHFAGINKILRIPKVFRVLKELEDICVYRSNVLRFLSYTLLMLIACFLIASLQQGFMCFQFGHCLVTNLTHPPYWVKKPLDEETLEHRITFGLYWAISMIMFTTHYESWGTESWYNVLYAMLILEICIVLRIFMEAVYSATIMVTTALREDYDAAISIVKSFLIRNQVDPILRQRFIDYLQLCWFTDKAYSMTNKRSIFYDLPSHVYQDIVAKQCSKYILCIPIMKYLHKEDLKKISSNARLFHTSPNEILMNTGDISNEIYIIKRGICEVLSPDTKTTVDYLSVKSHFGALACLLRLPAYYTIRAVTHVQVFSISRKYLMPAIEIPRIKDAIDFAKQQPEFQRLNRRREPFASYTPPAPTPNMERFRLPRKHEQDYAFLQPFHYLGFFSILRYIFPRFTIRPDCSYLVRYECFRAVCAFLTAIVYPAYCYLVLQWPAIYYFSILLDLSAYFDIFQRMLVGFFNEQGILIYHPVSTASHYLKGAFMIDMFGSIALERLESAQNESGRYRVTQMEQFLMLNRLIQLYRLPSAMHILNDYIERRDIRIVLQAIPLFIVLLNVLTCFMVLYSVNIFHSNDGNWEIIPNNDEGGSWIELYKKEMRFNLTETPWNLHLATYFWVVYETTTTGYNIFNPSNFELMRVLFIGMVIGAMIITYFSVRIISVRANVNKPLAEFQEHMKDMVFYMRRENLHEELQRDVLAYYEYNWDKMGGVDYRNMFKLCNQITLRTDIILHIYGPTFGKCPILSQSDASLLRTIGRAVHSRYFLRGMSIIDFSDVISDMYFVDYGEVAFRETKQETSSVVKLSRGSVFGNLDGAENIRCPMMVVAHSKLHLLMINSQAFHNIIKDFPTVLQLMTKYRPNANLNYIKSYTGDSFSSWKVRSFSSPMIVRSRKGLIKHLYFKDTYVQRYLIIVSLLCVYADVYNAGFQDNRFGLIIILYALDLGFYLKIVIQYSLPVIVESTSMRNVLIPKRREYFRTEFKYDIFSCLPFELLSLFSHQYRWMLFSWLRLNRMFRIVTLFKCLKRHHERITINLILSTMFSVIIWFTLFVHTIACLWYFIGVMEDQREPKSSWRYKDDGQLWCENLYLCSLYFVLTTFTQNGVGDIMPKKHSEVIFVCALQIISTMVYMIYVGEFSNIIQYQSFRSFSFYTKYLELQEFLGNNRVSANLVRMVNRYCLHLWRESRGMQAPHFLGTAPYSLRLRIMSAAYMHHLTKHHVFEDCEPSFLRQLVGCLQIYTYNEDMYVVKAREITDAMYLIHTGKVKEISHETCQVTRVCPAGSYFGVLQGLFRNTPYTHSYQTLAKSQVLTLRLDDWLFLLKHFPESCASINKHMRHDDSKESNRSSSSHYSWPYYSPKPPKPRVTELVDRGSQPSPHSSTISSPFIPPAGPSRDSNPHSQVDAVDHNRWPTNSRRISDYRSFEQINIKLDSNQSMPNLTEKTPMDKQEEHHDRKILEKNKSSISLTQSSSKPNDAMDKQSNSKYILSSQSSESQTGIFLLLEDIMNKSDENKRLSDTHYIELDDNDNIPIFEKDSGESTVSKNLQDEKKEPPVFALEIYEPKPGVSGAIQPDKGLDKERKESGAIDFQMRTDSGRSILADGATDELIKENRSVVFGDTKDVPTSTSRLKRRAVRVRYEEDDDNSKKPSGSTEMSSIGQSTDLTITEQSLRTSDSDKSDTKDEEETGSSSPNTSSST